MKKLPTILGFCVLIFLCTSCRDSHGFEACITKDSIDEAYAYYIDQIRLGRSDSLPDGILHVHVSIASFDPESSLKEPFTKMEFFEEISTVPLQAEFKRNDQYGKVELVFEDSLIDNTELSYYVGSNPNHRLYGSGLKRGASTLLNGTKTEGLHYSLFRQVGEFGIERTVLIFDYEKVLEKLSCGPT